MYRLQIRGDGGGECVAGDTPFSKGKSAVPITEFSPPTLAVTRSSNALASSQAHTLGSQKTDYAQDKGALNSRSSSSHPSRME
jgi:hypothetical protein